MIERIMYNKESFYQLFFIQKKNTTNMRLIPKSFFFIIERNRKTT